MNISITLLIAFLLIVGFTLVTKNIGIGLLVTAVILLVYKLITRDDDLIDEDTFKL